ncbi:MAG: Hsp20/alpha crystallin family protein [Desulfobacterales bacterium]|nr:MAG: Hsp20/alpha crystallin family protein [Desulfobacterales bacterium]
MTIVRWDPFKDVAALQDRINRLFNESFGQTRDLDDDLKACAWRPAVDIYETESELVLKAELPGIRKEDVSVEVKDNVLTLKGERFPEADIDAENYFRREICYGTFERSFTLQERIQPDDIKATFKDGVLRVRVPKPEVETPKQVTVDVE